jgi:hypothetical protein
MFMASDASASRRHGPVVINITTDHSRRFGDVHIRGYSYERRTMFKRVMCVMREPRSLPLTPIAKPMNRFAVCCVTQGHDQGRNDRVVQVGPEEFAA